MAPSIESLCEKTGKQITGWVRMSRNHVFRGDYSTPYFHYLFEKSLVK